MLNTGRSRVELIGIVCNFRIYLTLLTFRSLFIWKSNQLVRQTQLLYLHANL